MRKYITEQDAERVAMIYVRGANPAQQIKVCEEYAEAKGYEVIGAVYDFEEELYKEIGNIDILLVSSLDRLSRSTDEFFSIEAALAEDGIRVESPATKTEYPYGTMYGGIYRGGRDRMN